MPIQPSTVFAPVQRAQVSPTKYPPGPPPNVCAGARLPPRIPQHRRQITPAGWCALGAVAFWGVLLGVCWLWLR